MEVPKGVLFKECVIFREIWQLNLADEKVIFHYKLMFHQHPFDILFSSQNLLF
jgi:hypothetical protein